MSIHGDRQATTPVTPSLLRTWQLPGPGSGKYERGAVLVIGGARKTPGAVRLAGTAALRAGAGRLTLAVAESAAVPLAVAFPEAGVIGLPETAAGSVRSTGIEALETELDAADAILIGPGLDDPDETTGLLRDLLHRMSPAEGPAIVIDAYALGILPRLDQGVRRRARHLILTPNPTESGILLGRDLTDPRADTADIAETYRAVVSCQGIIAQPAEPDPVETATSRCWEITTGSGGLGTSGSGDVLAGAIAGIRARGATDAQSACWATHLHAAAGDRLASRRGSPGYLARELADELPALMMELST
jgi:ADP-dependent NAD(P)H-hydrate dehydratase